MAVKILKNEKLAQIDRICKMQALKKTGEYTFFRQGNMVGYRRKSYRDHMKAGVSLITVMVREHCLAWEKYIGLGTRN